VLRYLNRWAFSVDIEINQIKKPAFVASFQSADAHTKRINPGTNSRAHPEFVGDRARDLLFVRLEEVVVGGVRHQRLLPHIIEHGATRSGGRSSLGVQALDKRGLGQEVTAACSHIRPD
jgi:hypothetical protein